MDERIKFIADILRADHNMTELCQIYNISRKTGYKWIERFQESGASGLEELDRRPQNCPHATPDRIVKQILELRFKHPTWGARKLRARLEETKSGTEWPATSTITAILHRSGLLHTAKRKRKVTPSSSPLAVITAPNQVWCMDFKGYFRCGNRQRCDPFTITDGHSRFIIRCQTVPKMDFEHVDAICEAAMREFGVPDRIRTDNGTPFATMGLLGLSKLSIKWLKLGIVHERITPGEPQQNGRHERMHRTLKRETATPPAFTLKEQQDRFDEFRRCFNRERPHEALAFKTPDSVYVASTRAYPLVLQKITYGDEFEVRTVRKEGDIKWQGANIFISELLRHELVGLRQMEDDLFEVYFGATLLGEIDGYRKTFVGRR